MNLCLILILFFNVEFVGSNGKCPTRIALWQPNMCFAWSNSKYIHQLLRNRERLEGKLVSTLLSQNMHLSWSARFLQKGPGLDSLQPAILLKIVFWGRFKNALDA